jgi:ferrochelatase
MSTNSPSYDALLLVSFGGPEHRDEVLPFLENVLRGRPVPRARMLEVAEHYYHFGGVSPINAQCRALMEALRPELDRRSIGLPIYWGNRNWRPLLPDTLREMAQAGVRRALAFVTSAFSSYSSCRQYLENLEQAARPLGSDAPQVDKIRAFYDHPLFIEATADRLRAALERLPAAAAAPASLCVAFTAHSIPRTMADACDYARQLETACRLVAERLGLPDSAWRLVYQSRSGRPEDPWLEPDILDHLASLAKSGVRDVAICPIGFLSDHMEVLYDLDVEAAARCRELNLTMARAETVGTHPRFVEMVGELIAERLDPRLPRRSASGDGPRPDRCPPDCCPAPPRRPPSG